MKNNKAFNLLKTMLKTSYDTGNMIDNDTKKLNKKSIKVWLIALVCIIVIYLSHIIVNSLKEIGYPTIFLDMFFLLLQLLVMFQTILLVINVLYFSEDIENYLCLPISSMKLLITKFSVMITIIFGSELIIALPSMFIYGVRNLDNLAFYPLAVIVLVGVSIFLSTIVSIIMIFAMKIFRFIKNKYLYKSIVILIMTLVILMPLANVFNMTMNNIANAEVTENGEYLENSNNEEALEELKNIYNVIKDTNKNFIVTELGVKALSEINYNSILYILEILVLDILALLVFFSIGKYTYIKDVLWNLSTFDKKRKRRFRLNKNYEIRNKKYAYLRNEIRGIIKSSTYFMYYVYNVLVILSIIIMLAIIIFPIVVQVLMEIDGGETLKEIAFGFGDFSFIIGAIQVLFTLSSASLTAISRYGKNAIFFKYIPINFKTQLKLKNFPQLIINTIIVISVLGTIHYLIPAINNVYILLMFIISMLLNIINSDILLILDLLRPSLNYENEITVIKQNDNKLFQYILTVVSCLVIWYLKEVTQELSLNLSLSIEIIVFTILTIGIEIFMNKKSDKLFRKII